jgi:hypothetical protein
MKHTKIFVNGCSFSQSQGISHKNTLWKPWTDFLVEENQISVVNCAQSSQGQGRIVDSTINGIINQIVPIDYVIIQWSAVGRGMVSNQSDYINHLLKSGQPELLPFEDEYFNKDLPLDVVTDFANQIDYFYYKNTLTKIISLKSYLENNNIPYLFFWGWQQITDEMTNSSKELKKLLNVAYDGNWWLYGNHGGLSEYAIDMLGEDNAIIPNDFHPTTKSHELFYHNIIQPIVVQKRGDVTI